MQCRQVGVWCRILGESDLDVSLHRLLLLCHLLSHWLVRVTALVLDLSGVMEGSIMSAISQLLSCLAIKFSLFKRDVKHVPRQ